MTNELIGTWVFKDTIDLEIISYSGKDFTISFKSNNKSFNRMRTIPDGGTDLGNRLQYDNGNVIAYANNVWKDQAYKTIEITDVSSLTNRSQFESWLTKNATKQETYTEKDYQLRDIIQEGIIPSGKLTITDNKINDITNYQYAQIVDSNLKAENIKKGITMFGITGTYEDKPQDELLGKWVFRWEAELDNISATFNIGFKSNGNNYSKIVCDSPFGGFMEIKYDSTKVYNTNALFSNNAYKTIVITDTSKLTNRQEFETWLKANATKQ